jgi:hypothetical protein
MNTIREIIEKNEFLIKILLFFGSLLSAGACGFFVYAVATSYFPYGLLNAYISFVSFVFFFGLLFYFQFRNSKRKDTIKEVLRLVIKILLTGAILLFIVFIFDITRPFDGMAAFADLIILSAIAVIYGILQLIFLFVMNRMGFISSLVLSLLTILIVLHYSEGYKFIIDPCYKVEIGKGPDVYVSGNRVCVTVSSNAYNEIEFRTLRGADAKTFRRVSSDTYVDKDSVWIKSGVGLRRLEGADPQEYESLNAETK